MNYFRNNCKVTAITNSASRFEVRSLRASNFEDAICILQEWGEWGYEISEKQIIYCKVTAINSANLNALAKGLGLP